MIPLATFARYQHAPALLSASRTLPPIDPQIVIRKSEIENFRQRRHQLLVFAFQTAQDRRAEALLHFVETGETAFLEESQTHNQTVHDLMEEIAR